MEQQLSANKCTKKGMTIPSNVTSCVAHESRKRQPQLNNILSGSVEYFKAILKVYENRVHLSFTWTENRNGALA
jgi:hypothetical protein